MTGMTKETKLKLEIIKIGFVNGLTATTISKSLNITRAGVSDLIKRYLPHLTKSRRTLPKYKFIKQTELEKAQHERFCRKRINARRTGYTWNLEFKDINWPTHCPILGMELDYFTPFRQENSVSFDRINSNLGYVKGNVHIISWRANRIKNDGTAKEHQRIADFMTTLSL